MKNKNKQLRQWLDLGLCRCAALARCMSVSRQFISKISLMNTGISQNQWIDILLAMREVEEKEKIKINAIEHNVLRCAKQTANTDKEIATYAKSELNKWVIILSRYEVSKP